MRVWDLVLRLYRHRYGRWALHVLCWIFLFSARYYISYISLSPMKAYPWGIMKNSFFATVAVAVVYYLLVYFIYGRLWIKKKYVAAIIAAFLLLILYTFLDYLSEILLLKDPEWHHLLQTDMPLYYEYLQRPFSDILASRVLTLGIIYQLFFGLSFPLFLKGILAYGRQQLQKMELSRENVELEFNFLKSQVHPHFLHNTLNNIYSLILHEKNEEAAATVARLSAFMRYSLNNPGIDKVAAAQEISLIQDYIALEKIRLNHTTVHTRFETDEQGYRLPSLLLIPLLENAFKYSLDRPGEEIRIEVFLTKGELRFHCRNSFDPESDKSSRTGIGLNNVRKRLDQYFPGKYIFEAGCHENIYTVNLSIILL